MTKCDISFPLPLPDDPLKWEGWNNYSSPNLYERLCLDPHANPSNELIEEHCRELMRWWQKKLPLKNQPSNPLAQLLRSGLEESSRYLTEARLELLDPERRRAMDHELGAQLQEEAIIELHKYITFALADGILTPDAEKNLFQFGADQLRRTANPNYVIVKPLVDAKMGLFDLTRNAIVSASDKVDAALWGNLMVFESVSAPFTLTDWSTSRNPRLLA